MLSICCYCGIKLQNIKNNTERISKIKPFIDQYNCKEIDFPSHKKDWKEFESNNKSIALKVFYVPYNTEEIRHGSKSKHNEECKNQVILLMMTDDKKWHYLNIKNYLHHL